MAKVNLKKDWFAPDGTLYLARDNPHNFPSDWTLPKSAGAGEEPAAVTEEDDDEVKKPVVPAKK